MVSSSTSASDDFTGKALSAWHRQKMDEHSDIDPVMSKQARKLAVGDVNDFPEDAVVTYMAKHAEQIFEPKRILTSGDWLKSYREPDQRFDYYKQGKGNIKWVSPSKNKIYLFIAENDSFTQEQIKQYKLYASAFFTGADVEVIKAGEVIPGQNPSRPNKRCVPKNFLKTEIESREGWTGEMQYRTCGKTGILGRLPVYRPQDSYAMLCITMKDLYPSPNWNFCFGWASFTEGVGAFSFRRYDPEYDGIDDPDREKNLLMRGCAIMCHEIGHQFGLRHCIYYECLMNGIMSAEEQRQGGIRILCPVCQKKLKQNLKFDSAERFERLADVCEQLGFDEEAAVYRKLLKDTAESGIVARPKARDNLLVPAVANRKRATSNDARVNTAASRTDRPVGVRKVTPKKLPIWR